MQFNMMEMDRARFYYWNLFSIAVTALPLAYMATVSAALAVYVATASDQVQRT